MKSPGVIYRRYRQLKKKILYDKITLARYRSHENCYYGKTIRYVDETGVSREVRMCVYGNLDPEVCTYPNECSAFVQKNSRQRIVDEFQAELGDPVILNEKYPELALLEWVLDKDLEVAKIQPNFFSNLIVRIIEILEKTLKKL